MFDIKAITPPHCISAGKQRQEWIDCLRGITMLLVVMLHCEYTFCHNTQLSIDCFWFRMPLFFFISGFFAYRKSIVFSSTASVVHPLKKRILMVLWPTLLIMTIYYFAIHRQLGKSFTDIIFDQFKGNYWFTIVSVEIFFLSLPFICLLNSTMATAVKWSATAALMVVASFTGNLIEPMQNPAALAFSLHMVLGYMPFFMLGIFFRYHLQRGVKMFVSPAVAVSLCVACALFIHYTPTLRFGVLDWRLMPVISILVYAIFNIAYHLKFILNRGNVVGRALSRIGRTTLQIYLFHFFITISQPVSYLGTVIPWDILGQVPRVCIGLVSAVCVSYLCLMFDHLLSKTPIYKYLFPKVATRPVVEAAA